MLGFNQKKRINELEERINVLERKVSQLSCKHGDYTYTYVYWSNDWYKKCNICGLVIKYLSTAEKNKDEAKQLRERAEKLDPVKIKKRGTCS